MKDKLKNIYTKTLIFDLLDYINTSLFWNYLNLINIYYIFNLIKILTFLIYFIKL